MRTRDRSLAIAVVASFTFALGLRLWNLPDEAPFLDAVRESVALDAATEMLDEGRFEPALRSWPGGLVTLTLAPVGLIHLIGGVPLSRPDEPGYSPAMRPAEQRPLVLGARLLIALLGALVAAIVARSARYLSESPAGPLLAGFVVALLPAHVHASQRLWPEVPASLGVALALLASLAIVRRGGSPRRILGAGAAVGLAAAFELAGCLVVLAVITAVVLDASRSRRRRFLAGVVVLGVAAVVFAMLSPWSLLAPAEAWAAAGAVPRGGAPLAALVSLASPDLIGPALLALAGLSVSLLFVPRLRESQGRALTVLLIPVVAWLLLLAWRGPSASAPLAAILAPALALLVAATVCGAMRIAGRPVLTGALLAGVALALVPTALAGGSVAWSKGLPSTRSQALDWFVSQVPSGARVARDWRGPELNPERFAVAAVPTVVARGWERALAGEPDFLVLTSASFALAEGDGARAREVKRRLERLFSQRPAAAFCPEPDRVRGPEIWVFPRSDRARRQLPRFEAVGHCRYDAPWIP